MFLKGETMIIFARCKKCKVINYYPGGFYRGNNKNIIHWICKQCGYENNMK